MPITFDVREHPLFKEGVELGIEKGRKLGLKEGLAEAKKQDAINLYKETKWSVEKIARILQVDPQKVEKWLREENLLKE